MKKTQTKIIIAVFAVCLILFLLLPVFKRNRNGKPRVRTAAQAVSSNPLASAGEYLAELFGLQKSAPARDSIAAGADTPPRPHVPAGAARGGAAGVERASSGGGSYDENNVNIPPDFGQTADGAGAAQVKNDSGDWVFVQQQTPPVAARGMYDVNLQDTPLSAAEGRRISDAIARSLAPNARVMNEAAPLTLLGPAGAAALGAAPPAGTVFASNSFAVPAFSGGAYSGSGGKGGGLSGFGGSSPRYAGGFTQLYGVNDLGRDFAYAQNRAGQAGARYNPDGTPMSPSQQANADREGQNARQAADFTYAMAMAEADIAAKLKQEAASSELNFFEGEQCRIDRTPTPTCYEGIPKETIDQSRLENTATLAKSFLPPGANLNPKDAAAFTKSNPQASALAPVYVYVLFKSTGDADKDKAQASQLGVKPADFQNADKSSCPSGEKCFYVANPKAPAPSYFQHLSEMAVGKMKYDGPPAVNDKNQPPNSTVILVREKDLVNFAAQQNKDVFNSKDGSVYYVTAGPANSQALYDADKTTAFFSIPLDKDSFENADPEVMVGTAKMMTNRVADHVSTFVKYATQARQESERQTMIDTLGRKKQ